MDKKYDNFLSELKALCDKHGIELHPSKSDYILITKAEEFGSYDYSEMFKEFAYFNYGLK
jgi:hypothetical protein